MSSPSKATRWATALAVPLVLAAGTAPAFATGDTYTVNLHQKLPLTATSDGVERGECPNTIPADKDGWHFVLPTNGTSFVKLTVTFQPGGQQVITTFGPPTDKHAYVASPAGATLTSAVAQVKGGEVKWFNLSHACPAKPPTTPPTTKPPTTNPPTTAPPTTAAPSTSKPPVDGTKTPAPVTSSAGTGSPSSSASPTASDSVAPTASKPATGGGGKSLAQTGTVAVGGLLATAAVLVGGGILLRRRRGNHAA